MVGRQTMVLFNDDTIVQVETGYGALSVLRILCGYICLKFTMAVCARESIKRTIADFVTFTTINEYDRRSVYVLPNSQALEISVFIIGLNRLFPLYVKISWLLCIPCDLSGDLFEIMGSFVDCE